MTQNASVLDKIGTTFTKKVNVDEALAKAGLDWEVDKVQLYADWQGKKLPVKSRWGLQRQDTGVVLGTVGSTYVPYQNSEGFEVLATLIDMAGGEVKIENAGELGGGKKVYIQCRCTEALQIAGEKFKSYIGFATGHDGRGSIVAFLCDTRIVCENTYNFAIGEAGQAGRLIRVRHTVKASERLAQAADVLKLRNLRLEELAVQGEWLVDQKMSDSAFEIFIETLMPLPADAVHEGTGNATPAATMITKRREQIQDLYMTSPNLKPIRGTKWGALNAVIEYVDHGRDVKNTSALALTQMGLTPNAIEQKAATLLYNRK